MLTDYFFKKKLKFLYNLINNEEILDLNNIMKEIYKLKEFGYTNDVEYLDILLNPRNSKQCKLKNNLVSNSVSFCFKKSGVLHTNAYGCTMLLFNPFFLADENLIGERLTYEVIGEGISGAFISNATTLWVDGLGSDYRGEYSERLILNPNFIGQMIPKKMYDYYRLVSASLEIKYINPIQESEGVICGSIINESQIGLKYYVSLDQDDDYDPEEQFVNSFCSIGHDYSDINKLRKALFFKEKNAIEGIKFLYYPIDNSYNDYLPIFRGYDAYMKSKPQLPIFYEQQGFCVASTSIFKSGFCWCFQAKNCIRNKLDSFKYDICCNFECIPNISLMTCLPFSRDSFNIPLDKEEEIISLVQKQCIQ